MKNESYEVPNQVVFFHPTGIFVMDDESIKNLSICSFGESFAVIEDEMDDEPEMALTPDELRQMFKSLIGRHTYRELRKCLPQPPKKPKS